MSTALSKVVNGRRGVHSDRLDRWLGAEETDRISKAMAGWYGPPIAVAGVPGRVFVDRGGDFRGLIDEGAEACVRQFARDRVHRARGGFRQWSNESQFRANAGFTSLSDLIAKATSGRKRDYPFQKTGTTGALQSTNSLWRATGTPAAGSVAAAAPGGEAPDRTTLGAMPFRNPTSGETQHVVRVDLSATVANTLLIYDRIFSVGKTMNSVALEAVTGVPARYQNTVSGTEDSAEGNFLFIECMVALAATAHNWTTCLYTPEDGGADSTLPTVVGNSANIINRLDQPAGTWFAPLAAGDTGIKALTQMQCSATVATGTINFSIGHPVAFVPVPVANLMFVLDGINSAFNLTRIFDDACLATLEITKPVTTATIYNGMLSTVSG